MAAAPIPLHGRWAWDVRGDGRAVRVSAHAESGLINVSLWRENACVGSARLLPVEAARLVNGLTDGLASLAGERPAADAARRDERLHELELRVARLEARPPSLHRTLAASWEWARRLGPPRRRPADSGGDG